MGSIVSKLGQPPVLSERLCFRINLYRRVWGRRMSSPVKQLSSDLAKQLFGQATLRPSNSSAKQLIGYRTKLKTPPIPIFAATYLAPHISRPISIALHFCRSPPGRERCALPLLPLNLSPNMLHGLLWFPLLGFFVWIAWAGWSDYQKIETYRQWASGYPQSKYDLYSALRADATSLTWGTPQRQVIANLQTLSLADITEVALQLNGSPVPADSIDPQAIQPKNAKNVALVVKTTTESFAIPFTEQNLAIEWAKWLQGQRSSADLS